MTYRIKTVASITGIPKNTLLAWERRYGIVHPGRADNGYRVYSETDVLRLQRLKDLVDMGHAISEAVQLVASPSSAPAAVDTRASSADLSQVRRQLVAALLEYDRATAHAAVQRLRGVPFRAQLDEVYFPLMKDVGDAWEAQTACVAQEHFATGFVRDQLTRILLELDTGPTRGPRAMCACFEGEQHELGLLGVAIRLALRGWRVVWLGANVPADEILGAVRAQLPRLVCVSVMTPVEPTQLLAFGQAVRDAAGAGVPVVLGGAGVPVGLTDDDVTYASGAEILDSAAFAPPS